RCREPAQRGERLQRRERGRPQQPSAACSAPGIFGISRSNAADVCKTGRLYHRLVAVGRGLILVSLGSARCAFATIFEALSAIGARGIYRPRDCRNPSLIAPSTDADGRLSGAPTNACQSGGAELARSSSLREVNVFHD